MRQIPHKKPPFYSKSTKRVSYKIFSLSPLANALHEQAVVRLKESIIYSGEEEASGIEAGDPRDELRAFFELNVLLNTQNVGKQLN